jgi:GAF domain-containing protein
MRSVTLVPLLREGAGIGALSIQHSEPGFRLNEKQLALVRTFADQAVIAIENTRLFNETREGLEKQTATAEILRVLSSNPADTQPVFEAIARNAARLCGSAYANVFRYDGERLHLAASYGVPAEVLESLKRTYPMAPNRSRIVGRVILERRVVRMEDADADREYDHAYAHDSHQRRILGVPLERAGEPLGAIAIGWQQPGPILDRHEDLLRTFADQAVIAIENVRLFNETKEALERQTATSDVLRIISTSPGDVEPVLQSIAERAATLCEAKIGFVARYDGKLLHMAAFHGARPGALETMRGLYPMDPSAGGSVAARVVRSREMVQVHDVLADAEYAHKIAAEAAGFRSVLGVPLLREGAIVGAIIVVREQAGAFPPNHVELLKTFADQAAIAIENARLFNETKEALERQTATAEILRVIAGSPSTVQPVFEAIVRSAQRLVGAFSAAVSRLEGTTLHLEAHTAIDGADEALRAAWPLPIDGLAKMAEALRTRSPVYIEDMQAATTVPERFREVARKRGYRAVLHAPMARDGTVWGFIHVSRVQPGSFSDHHIRLIETFASQAVIAIENVRLFNETKEALEQQKASAEVLGAISSSIADASPVFDKILEGCERLFEGQYMSVGMAGDDGFVHIAARRGTSAADSSDIGAIPVSRESGSGLAVIERRIVHVPDVAALTDGPSFLRRNAEKHGLRSVIFAPMFWDDKAIGTITVGRKFAGAFTDKQIALLKTFADQAVIAIQNARLFREIQEKSRQLEEASRHKSQFLASMSHELRTPLNAILGFNEMILGGIYGDVPGDMTEPLKDVQTSGKHLLRLINNVLDLAKIEAGRMELALGDYSVQDTVASVHATLRPLAAEKGLEFVTGVPPDVPLAHGDAGRITQCLMNLAGNSLKFTKHGRVAIDVRHENGRLRYSVTDTGIGIPPDKIASLFTEFKQTDATIASEFGGTGLGLSITKKFIEMHGGRIWVESEPGKGSAFRFEVPLRVSA